MKQIKMWVMLVSFFAITAITLTGCMKDSLPAKEAVNQADVVQTCSLSVFYNGNPVESIESVYANRNRDADMELVSVMDTTEINFFDVNLAFFQYCSEQDKIPLYEANAKLDSIYAKAVDLNLMDSTVSLAASYAMESYWYSVFNTSIIADTNNDNRTCLAIHAYDSESIGGWGADWVYFAVCRAKLFTMDRIISSMTIFDNVGWVVWCQKRWFGSPRTFYPGFYPMGSKDYSLAGSPDNNKYRSYFRILP